MGTKIKSGKISLKKCEKTLKTIYIYFLTKIVRNQVGSVNLCSFAFNNQNLAQS